MNFGELKDHLWWVCDNGQNPDDLEFLYDTAGDIINRAVRDLADCLHIVKHTKELLPDSNGDVSLPPDGMEFLRVQYGEVVLAPLSSVHNIPYGTGAGVTKFYQLSRSKIRLYYKPVLIPTGLTVTPQGFAGSTTWGYRVTAVGSQGESLACAEVVTATGNASLGADNFNRLNWTQVAGALSYNIYRTTAGGSPSSTGLIGCTDAVVFDDTGLAAVPSTLDSRVLHVWYRAYPAALVNDADVPADIPVEFHEALAEIYGRGQFAKKVGDMKTYYELCGPNGVWRWVKKELRGIVAARTEPTDYYRQWKW